MRNTLGILFVSIFVLIYIIFFWSSFDFSHTNSQKLLINDVSRLNPTYVKSIVKNEEIQGIQDVLSQARREGDNVSIAGRRHSMGGHTFYNGSVVLDMTSYNKILNVDQVNKIISVQSGATWGQVFDSINPYNLSVEVMQAYNGFTIGGSLSVNVHESDPRFGPLIQSVKSFRLLLANGTIVSVSRTENPELFSLVIGGYGLFGVILDADLYLTDNKIYQKTEYTINYKDYYQEFSKIKSDSNVEQIFARLSIAKDESFLKDLVITKYTVTNITDPKYLVLNPPSHVGLKKFIFGLSRNYNWGKKFRWYLQKDHSDLTDPSVISRNNLMDEDVSFLDYHSSTKTDILQEYFIPVGKLPEFIDNLRNVVKSNDINLLSATIRYVPKNEESMLSYSHKDEFGVVLYFNIGLSDEDQNKVQLWTQELTDDALQSGGTYYLPYKLYASKEQIRKAYPNIDYFFTQKRKYDPQELFMNNFYDTYARQK